MTTATYGLNVYKKGTSNLDAFITATRATLSARDLAALDEQIAFDNANISSTRAAVLNAFADYVNAPPIPTETEVRYWMLVGLGNNNYSFKVRQDGYYTTGTGGYTAAQYQAKINAARYNIANTLSPYPVYQSDNEITVPSQSTQDSYGNNKTSLFLGISNLLEWNWDLATIYGFAQNYITNYGLGGASTTHPQYQVCYRLGDNGASSKEYMNLGASVKFNEQFSTVDGYSFEIWVLITNYNYKKELFNYSSPTSTSNDFIGTTISIEATTGIVSWYTAPFNYVETTEKVPLNTWTLISCILDRNTSGRGTKSIYINGYNKTSIIPTTPADGYQSSTYVMGEVQTATSSTVSWAGGSTFSEGQSNAHSNVIRLMPGQTYPFSIGDKIDFVGLENTSYYLQVPRDTQFIITNINHSSGYISLDKPVGDWGSYGVPSGVYIKRTRSDYYLDNYRAIPASNQFDIDDNRGGHRRIIGISADNTTLFISNWNIRGGRTDYGPMFQYGIDTAGQKYQTRFPSFPVGCAVVFGSRDGKALPYPLKADQVYYINSNVDYGNLGANNTTSNPGVTLKDSSGAIVQFTAGRPNSPFGTAYDPTNQPAAVLCNMYKVADPKSNVGWGTIPNAKISSTDSSANLTLASCLAGDSYYIGQIRICNKSPYNANSNTIGWPDLWELNGEQSTAVIEKNIAVLPSSNVLLCLTRGTSSLTMTQRGVISTTTYFGQINSINVSAPAVGSGAPNTLGTRPFDGASNYVSIYSTTSAFYFPSGTDFCIETYIFLTAPSFGRRRGIIGQFTASSSWSINFGPDPYFITVYINGSLVFGINSGTTYGINTLYHIALTRSGSTLKLFINGTQVGSTTNNSNIGDTSSYLTIGRDTTTADSYFEGYMGSPRIVRGKAIYTSSFTPIIRKPAAPRTKITTAYAENMGAPRFPDEASIQYWMLVGLIYGAPEVQFSSNDVTWNQVDFFYLPENTPITKQYDNCVNRTISVSQYIIGTPSSNTAYRLGTYTTTPSTGTVSIASGNVPSYVLILMK